MRFRVDGEWLIDLRNAGGPFAVDINYLAVWREEGGKGRFLAWQSCRNPPPGAAKLSRNIRLNHE